MEVSEKDGKRRQGHRKINHERPGASWVVFTELDDADSIVPATVTLFPRTDTDESILHSR